MEYKELCELLIKNDITLATTTHNGYIDIVRLKLDDTWYAVKIDEQSKEWFYEEDIIINAVKLCLRSILDNLNYKLHKCSNVLNAIE